ncbi:MAG: (2Fe-2S)-binding protein [Granulosicoccus sp.]
MFKPLIPYDNEKSVSFTFEGEHITAMPDMSVAAALLAHCVLAFRYTPVSGSARGPFCLMGTCYDCLIVVDGETVQACMTPVHEGLIVTRVPIANAGTV